jgi:hypothetical protein
MGWMFSALSAGCSGNARGRGGGGKQAKRWALKHQNLFLRGTDYGGRVVAIYVRSHANCLHDGRAAMHLICGGFFSGY